MDLTTLYAVKQYLAIASAQAGTDPLIRSLIPRESRAIERYTSRRFPYAQVVARRLDGSGTTMLTLPDQPILSIDLLSLSGVEVVAAAAEQGPGYRFDDTTIYLAGGARFPMGRQNVVCSWAAGYRETAVEADIPDANTPLWIQDPGSPAVIYGISLAANGSAFVATSNTPQPGEFNFNAPLLTFNAADAGTAILVDMSYVPGPIEQACIEMVGLDLKQRDNLGIRSKTLAAETISYEGGGMTQSVKDMLNPFRKMAPV